MSRTTEPTEIMQGERIAWTKALGDYPADEWTLEYRIRGVGPGVDVECTADGTVHEAEITAAASTLFSIGEYRWQAWITEQADTDNTFAAGAGIMQVRRGFVDGETGDIDMRSPAKIALDAIDAALANAATSDQMEYEISTPAGSRRIKRMSRSELIDLRNYYAAIVARENHAERVRNGGPWAKPVKARMFEQ